MMKWILFCSTLLLVSCGNIIKPPGSTSSKELIYDSLVIRWQHDSFGCMGFRKDSTLNLLFSRYGLKRKSIEEIKEVLGGPNLEDTTGGYIYMRYYFGTICLNNKIVPDSDACWFTISVDTSGRE